MHRLHSFKEGSPDSLISLLKRGLIVANLFANETRYAKSTQLARKRTHRNQDKNGLFRWYNDYALPDEYGGGTITVRLHGDESDAARKFNRTENIRPIAPTDPDSRRSTLAATTRNRSTGLSTTPCGLLGRTASDTSGRL